MTVLMIALGAALGALLYRLRGGALDDWTSVKWGTHVMRLTWSLPAGLGLALAADPTMASAAWLMPASVVAAFLSLALLGHGAHMVMDAAVFVSDSDNKTELLTDFWLPDVFGGVPDESWLSERSGSVTAYNVVGMTVIGAARTTIASLPIAFVSPWVALAYALTGLAHGCLYWAGWRVGLRSQGGEYLVGALSGAVIAAAYVFSASC